MNSFDHARALIAVLMLAALPASAAADPGRDYRSAFDGYRPFAATPAPTSQTWREANNTAAKLGGHAGHLKGAASAGASTHEHGKASNAPQGHHHHHGRHSGTPKSTSEPKADTHGSHPRRSP